MDSGSPLRAVRNDAAKNGIQMPNFTLHPQLEADSFLMRDLPLCQLRLNNQKNAPWFVLVPRRPDIKEIFELSYADQTQLMREITQTSKAIYELYAPDKINVGALGNIVPQLHIHIIARFKSDDAWPDPIWGKLSPAPYTADAIRAIKDKLNLGILQN